MPYLGIDIGGSSVKAAVIRDGIAIQTGRSVHYQHPSREALVMAIRSATAVFIGPVEGVCLCLPGSFDPSRRAVSLPINVPSLVGENVDRLISDALQRPVPPIVVVTDAHATAHDLYVSRQLTGRLFVLALGTGVGGVVLDDGAIPLRVDGDSSGHFGQIDVSLADAPVIGPDGGRGSLEGYLGASALRLRYGDAFYERIPSLDLSEAPMRALIRATRIAHALYRPQHVMLAGGIGIQLRAIVPAIHREINRELTSIARQGWTLTTGDNEFHAAIGAARLAITSFAH